MAQSTNRTANSPSRRVKFLSREKKPGLAARAAEGYAFLAYGIDALFLTGAAGCPKL